MPVPTADRRDGDRTHNEPWPEAMREEFRKVQFLAAVEVDEVDPDTWHDLFATFKGRHLRVL